MKKFIFLSLVFILFVLIAKAQQDTILDLSQIEGKSFYKAPNGKVYQVSFEEAEQPIVKSDRSSVLNGDSPNSNNTSKNKPCDHNQIFDGVYRKKAKTSVASHQASGTNLARLITRLKKIDKNTIKVSSSSPRIAMEDSNVTLMSVFLYAIAREADEDYHMIIGTSNNPAKAKFFNIECSGLPASTGLTFKKLKETRQKVTALLGGLERCRTGYIIFTDPPKVKIIGSLFYDKQHEKKIPGPSKFKPQTAWELHPITEFELL